MAPKRQVVCENCEEKALKFVEEHPDGAGYLCPNASDYPAGQGCHVLVSRKDYRARLPEDNDEDNKGPPAKKRKTSGDAMKTRNIQALLRFVAKIAYQPC